jgi:hypothetical protein
VRLFIYQLKYLYFIISIFIITFGFIGLLFDLHWGFLIGSLIALLLISIFSVWGEKIILIFVKARYVTDDEILINQVKNFCCHCEIPEVKVYWSNVFVNNLYFTNSYFGKPALVIGRNVYNSFTRSELNSLIYASLLRFRSNEAKHRTFASLIFLILYFPVYFLRSLFKTKSIKSFLNVFLYPAYFIKSKLYENEKIVFGFDQRVGMFSGLKEDYISALFKVSYLPICKEFSVGGMLINELNNVNNQTTDMLNYILINHVKVEARAKELR